jgi:hypothetical protein
MTRRLAIRRLEITRVAWEAEALVAVEDAAVAEAGDRCRRGGLTRRESR